MKILLAIFLAVLGLAMFSGNILLQRKWSESSAEQVQTATPEPDPEADPAPEEGEELARAFEK